MEERKNNAVEKVEKAALSGEEYIFAPGAEGVEKKGEKEKQTKKNPVKHTKTAQSKQKPKSVVQESDEIRKEQMRVIKEKQREQKRMEIERIRRARAEALAERREEARREQIRRAEVLATERMRRKEERAARRDMLRSESTEARSKRKAEERKAAMHIRQERAELRAKLVSEKRERRAEAKRQKGIHRTQDRQSKRARGVGGWIAAVVSLGCAVLVLGTLFTFNLMFMSDSKNLLNASYERAFYDLAGCVDNIDVNLSKLTVAKSPAQQQKLLTDIIVQSELAESELQMLPLGDESKYSTGKFINQLGDYSKTLSYKIANGTSITDEDRQLLEELHRRNGNLQKTLSGICEQKGARFKFISLLKPEEDNAVISNFGELENNSLEYPKMIYDGPFSDGLDVKHPKGLEESEVTRAQALKSFKALFSSYSVKDAEIVNEGEGSLATYNIEASTENGYFIYAQMTKRGGRLALFNCYEPCKNEKFTLDECREIAEVFVKKAGFDNMKPVWETASRTVAQFNFAYELDGVIVYSDLVKVNVCMERGLVSAVEASSYYYNHVERDVPKAKLTAGQAVKAVSPDLEVESVRKAVIPLGGGRETLAYEVFGECRGRQFFVYIDALTGREAEIFEVVETAEGRLII